MREDFQRKLDMLLDKVQQLQVACSEHMQQRNTPHLLSEHAERR